MTAAVLRSEWLKLRSVHSTHYALGVVAAGVVIALALGWYVVNTWDGESPVRRDEVSVMRLEGTAAMIGQISLAVLGVVTMTSEYASGQIRLSLLAVPRRWPVVLAKATVVAAVAGASGLAAVVTAYAGGRLIAGDRPIRHLGIPVSDAIPVLLGLTASLVVFALVGLCLGAILRSTASAITAVVGLWYVLPVVALNLPEPWADRISALTLTRLADQLAGTHQGLAMKEPFLSPWAAGGVAVAYVLISVAAAVWLTNRRDV